MASYSLTAIFGLDATGFKTEVKQLTAETRSFVNEWGKIAAGAAVGAFVALSKGAIDLASHLTDTALNLGINVISLQALQNQHKLNGVSEEQFTKALEKTKEAVISGALENNKARQAFKALGVSMETLLLLPLDKQYEMIAKAIHNASDKNIAYNAAIEIFGAKLGPQMMASLNELATKGLPKVTEEQKKLGAVLDTETTVALKKAGDAIEQFKTKATVAVGNIIVNFRTEEGLKLLWLELSGVVLKFGAGILDAIVDSATFLKATYGATFIWLREVFQNGMVDAITSVATALNKVLPNKFQIDIAGLEKLRVASEDFGTIVSREIANTEPSNFKKTIGDANDKLVADQLKVVNAVNKIDLKPEADKLAAAAKPVQTAIVAGADALAKAAAEAAKALAEAAKEAAAWLMRPAAMLGARGGKQFNTASDSALEEILRRDTSQAHSLRNDAQSGGASSAFSYTDRLEAGRLEVEANNARAELDTRNRLRTAFASGGEQGVFRAFPTTDPLILSKMIDQFAKNLDVSQQTQQSVQSIERGLVARGIIPNL